MADDLNPAHEPHQVAPSKPPLSEIDAVAAFVAWAVTANVPPRVLELFNGPTRFKLYRGTKEVTFDDYQHLVDTIVRTLERLDGQAANPE